jgi:poly-D-alanine transfer protein DltD
MPIHDAYSQQLGTSASSRAAYYARLSQAIGRYDVPFLDLAEYGSDAYFLCDPNSHLSDKGWVVIDQTLDAFYFNVVN